MKLEDFFEKFDLFAEAPGAVAKMRDMLIHLAVSGKIVANDPTEKPVTLTSSGPQSDDSDLPSNWRSGIVGDVFSFEYGDNLPAPQRTETGEYPVYGSNGIVGTHATYLTKEPAIIVGRKGSAGALNIADGPSWTTDVAYCVCPPHDVDLRFTYYLFWTLRLDELGKGIKPGLSRKEAYILPISLPPLAEQKRIVAKVDELMALCDRLEAQQQERETRQAALARASLARFADAPTSDNLQFLFHPSYAITPADLRKSILTLAVQGRLVSQDSNDESASRSVEIVAKEARSAISAGIIRRYGHADDSGQSQLSHLPMGWRWSRLTEVVKPIPYAIKRGPFGSAITKGMFVSQGYKIYEQQHAISGDFSRGRYYISSEKFQELLAFELHPGEVLISCSGTVGKVAIVPSSIEPGIINQALLKLSLHQSALLNDYFLILFPAFFMETETLTDLQGTAQKNIPGMDVLKGMPFPHPPLAEQRRIVAKVYQLMALVDELETHLATSRATAANLLSALVDELTGTSRERRAPARQVVTEDDHLAGDVDATNTAMSRPSRAGARRSQEVTARITADENTVLRLASLLREKGNLSNAEAQAATGLDAATIRTHLQALVAAGRARTEGQRRGMRYVAVK